MRLTVHDHAMIHGVGILSRYPIDRVREHDDLVRRALAEVVPGINRRFPGLAPVAVIAERLAAGRGDPMSLSCEAARIMHEWDRRRLTAALDLIRGATA